MHGVKVAYQESRKLTVAVNHVVKTPEIPVRIYGGYEFILNI